MESDGNDAEHKYPPPPLPAHELSRASQDGDLGASSGNAPGLTATTPPRSDVDEILRKKRKAREYKACYPCRQRKVKCDQTVPCKTCVGE